MQSHIQKNLTYSNLPKPKILLYVVFQQSFIKLFYFFVSNSFFAAQQYEV